MKSVLFEIIDYSFAILDAGPDFVSLSAPDGGCEAQACGVSLR